MSIDGCRWVELPRISDERGSLTVVEARKHIPFAIERIYYLYDVPEAGARGGHAHKQLEQLFIAMAGSFELVVDDGVGRKSFTLDQRHRGLYMPRMLWRELSHFSAGAVCLVLASLPYDENDYFRDYNQFLAAVRGGT
jgi:dTDP-4-dehydrorhamnose 3,5-epimerase-like enzyme